VVQKSKPFWSLAKTVKTNSTSLAESAGWWQQQARQAKKERRQRESSRYEKDNKSHALDKDSHLNLPTSQAAL